MKNTQISFSFYFLLISIGFFGLLLACNKIGEDINPNQIDKMGTIATTASTPVVVDLIKKHNITSEASFSLNGQPAKGEAKFMGNGLLMYTPNLSKSTSRVDNVSYNICVNQNCKEFSLAIEIVEKADSLPCEIGVRPDVVALKPNQNQIRINVLANDKFCQNPVNPNSLKIVEAPQQGTAQVIKVSADSAYISYTYTENRTFGGDYLVYSVEEKGNSQNIAYGVVKIIAEVPTIIFCPFALYADSLLIQPSDVNGKIIDVLKNDIFCADSVDWSGFKVVQNPQKGIATLTNDRKILYKPTNLATDESDIFTYQLVFKNGKANEVSVFINSKDNSPSVCPTVLLEANDDKLVIQVSDSTFIKGNFIDLPILANDIFCPFKFNKNEFKITQNPTQGTAEVIDSFWVRYYVPSTNFRGIIRLRYRICDTTCDEAEVELELKD